MDASRLPDIARQIESLAAAADAAGLRLPEIRLPERRSVLAGDHQLNLIDWGAESDSTILFLHDAGLTARIGDPICLALRDRYRYIAVDLRGHGDSEWSLRGDSSVGSIVLDLKDLLGDLGGTPMVFGHSMGGLTAVRYSVNNPDRVRGLAIVDIGPSTLRRQDGHQGAARCRRRRCAARTPSRASRAAAISRCSRFRSATSRSGAWLTGRRR